MRKLIRQYEEKNKIIEQIQKNLRMVQTKLIKPNLKIKPQVTNPSFQLDFPAINVRNDYTPKSHSNSADKKISYNVSIDQQLEQLIKKQKKHSKPWIQTISFQGENQRENKHILIINHRTTLRNFMRNTQKQHFSLNKQQQSQQNKGIFLSPSRMLLTNKIQQFKERKKLTFKQLQKVMQSKTQINFQKGHPKPNQCECEQDKKQNRNVDTKKDQNQNNFEPYIYKKMKKAVENNRQSLHKSIQLIKKEYFQFHAEQTELKRINTVVLSPHRYKRGHRKNKSNGRSYSPWNLQAQNAQLNQIWNIGFEK